MKGASLQRDERGMILIAAIPMAMVAVGCLFFIVSVGDTIAYRERLQASADGAAIESAILHARAMNVAAGLNLLLALLSSLAGLVRVLLWIGAAAATAGLGSGARLLDAAAEADSQITPRIATAVEIVSQTQSAWIEAAPILATVTASARHTVNREDGTQAAVALSYAALPRDEQQRLRAEAGRPWRLAPSSSPPATARTHREPEVGATPAAESGDDSLDRADTPSTRAQLPLIPASPAASCASARVLAEVTSSRAVIDQILQRAVEGQLVRELADQLHQPLSAALASAVCGVPHPSMPEAASGTPPRVHAHATLESKQRLSAGLPWMLDPKARNGNALLQTWSIVRTSEPAHESIDERGLRLVSVQRPVELNASRSAVAQAEYFFDCAGSWQECQAGAAYHPRWRPRLRRFERPDGDVNPARTERLARVFTRAAGPLEQGLRILRPRSTHPNGVVASHIRAFFSSAPCGSAQCVH